MPITFHGLLPELLFPDELLLSRTRASTLHMSDNRIIGSTAQKRVHDQDSQPLKSASAIDHTLRLKMSAVLWTLGNCWSLRRSLTSRSTSCSTGWSRCSNQPEQSCAIGRSSLADDFTPEEQRAASRLSRQSSLVRSRDELTHRFGGISLGCYAVQHAQIRAQLDQ